MIFKCLIFTLICLMLLFLCSDARRIRFSSRIRTGSSSSSSDSNSSSSLAGAGVGFLFMLSLCGCKLGSKLYECDQKRQRRERVQLQINRLIAIQKILLQTSTVDDLKETNLPMNDTNLLSNRLNTIQFTSLPLYAQLSDDVSEQMIDKNTLEHLDTQDSICPQQTTNKEENCSAIVPIEEVKISSQIH